jgi:VCBS repeat-containing protein
MAALASGIEDGVLPVSLGGQDVEGSIVAVTITSLPANGALFLADGVTPVLAGQALTAAQASQLLYRPSANFNGAGSFAFTVTDDGGAVSAPASFDLVVLAANDAPITAAERFNVNEDTALSGNVLSHDSDVEGASLGVSGFAISGATYSAGATASLPGIGTLQINADGSFLFTPQGGYNGPVPAVTYEVSDGATASSATLNITVNAVNDAPSAVTDIVSTSEDTPVTIDVIANDSDADGDRLTVIAVAGQPISIGSPVVLPGGVVSLNPDGTLTLTPDANFSVPLNFGYTISDGTSSSTGSVAANVPAVNDAPVAFNDLASTAIGVPVSIAVLANDRDPEGDVLTLSGASVANPSQGSVSVNADGTLQFMPAAGFSGIATINYVVADSSGASSTGSATVNVGTNTLPTGRDATLVLPEDSSRAFTPADFGFSDSDAGQSFANVRIDSLPATGSLRFDGVPVLAGQIIAAGELSKLVFSPLADGNGIGYAQLSFSVQDSLGGFDDASRIITFDVTPVADAAVMSSGSGVVAEDGTLTTSGTLTISDADSGQTSFTAQAATAGSFGTFTLDAAGAWTYALNNGSAAVQALGAGQTLTETFAVAALDGTTSSVTVTIDGSNDAAVLSAATAALTEDASVTAGNLIASGSLSVSDIDAGQAAFLPQLATVGTYGTFTVGSTGLWNYTASNSSAEIQALASGASVLDTFSVQSIDGTLTSVVVTLIGVNDAPVASVDSVAAVEDTSLVISAASLLANDGDIDNAAVLSITNVSAAIGGTVALNLSGNVVFTLTPNYSGPASFAYTISDGNGGTSTATVNVAVAAVADSPSLVTLGSVLSLQTGATSISTEPGISQANLEATLGLAAGQLDGLAPPAGVGSVTTNDAGTVDVADGKITSYTLSLGGGHTANFAWQFFNGEDLATEINDGYNDVVALVVTDPTGARQLIQVSSSEQVGPNTNAALVDAAGNYQFTAALAGEYQFSWLVLNGRDGAKDSSITVAAPTITIGGISYGKPVPLSIGAQLGDQDGSETLSINVSGVPALAAFSTGTNLGGGNWSFTAAQLSGLASCQRRASSAPSICW